jgi:hypothetical protein
MPARCPATPQLFLDADDGLGAHQTLREPGIIPLQLGYLADERVWFGGFWAAPGGNQGVESTGVPLPAPVGERRRIETLAAQDGADPTGLNGTVNIGQDAQLVLRGEGPATRAGGKFR